MVERRAALVVRRALGSPRDVTRAHDALKQAGVALGASLSAALADDRWGVVLLAEQRAVVVGVLVLRWVRAVGDGPDATPAVAWVDRCWSIDDDPSVIEALEDAARAEAESRDVTGLRGFTEPGMPVASSLSPPPTVPVAHSSALVLADGVTVRLDPDADPLVTLWNGAQAFRARRPSDRTLASWSADDTVGSREVDDGDALRFDATTRRLRECWLTRPSRVAFDEDVWRAAMSLEVTPAVLTLTSGDGFALPAMEVGVFDLALSGYVALRASDLAAGASSLSGWTAAMVSPEVALLFDASGRWSGWRVHDVVSRARPMGWPDVREEPIPPGTSRDALTALLYDWMCIDAGDRTRPDLAVDPDDIAHMVSLRGRARSLADAAGAAGDAAVAGVASDVAAQVYWSWGFFRVGD